MLKDVKLALGVAEEVNCKTELGKKSGEIYEQLVKAGLSKKDFGVIYDVILKNKL
jgi:3-hydroxyisobutyrate dehydrogenase-like beta-hydroxyacid dehydrogenase